MFRWIFYIKKSVFSKSACHFFFSALVCQIGQILARDYLAIKNNRELSREPSFLKRNSHLEGNPSIGNQRPTEAFIYKLPLLKKINKMYWRMRPVIENIDWNNFIWFYSYSSPVRYEIFFQDFLMICNMYFYIFADKW